MIGLFLLLATRRKPDIDKRQKDHHVLHRHFRSSRRGQSAEGHSIYQARPTQGEALCQMQKTMFKMLELISEQLINGDAVSVRRTPPAENRSWERDLTSRTGPLSVVTDAERDPFCAKDKNWRNWSEREPTIPNHNVFTHLPKDPNREVSRTDRTC